MSEAPPPPPPLPHPTPLHLFPKCDTLIFAARLSAPLISSSFLAPSIPLLHQVSGAASGPLTPWQRRGSDGQAGLGREVHRQPAGTPFSSRCHGEGGQSR